jgi:N-acetylglucosaminyldiphosphoundecaprenol N-acetyl-beta-D-mannosaminyltransferase
LDWRDDFWAIASENNWRVFFVGGAAGVGEAARANIQRTWPGVQLETHYGYFDTDPDSPDNRSLIGKICNFKPNVILVGMGMPLQETWVHHNFDALPASVIFTVGAAFDYEAGVQLACPRWIGRSGLEWLFRLASNPRRLFARYCIEPWSLVGPALRDLHDAARRSDGRLAVRKGPLVWLAQTVMIQKARQGGWGDWADGRGAPEGRS